MRRPQRLIAAAVLVALSGALAGCGGGGIGNFDPSDLLDFLDTKKKLPGERKPVFPDGVPGLDQGVPKDLYKGARQQQIDDPNAQAAAAAAPPPAEPKSKRGAQGQAGRRTGRRRARCRARGGRQHRRRAAGAQAPEDRAQAHHRAAARSIGARTVPAAIRRAVPGADAERLVHALISSFRSIDTPFEKGRLDYLCPLRLPSSAGPMSESRRCSTGWSGRSSRWWMTSPASRATAAREVRASAISNSPSSTPPASTRAPRAR